MLGLATLIPPRAHRARVVPVPNNHTVRNHLPVVTREVYLPSKHILLLELVTTTF